MKHTAMMAAFLLLFAAACDSGGKGGSADGTGDKGGDSKPLSDDDVDKAELPVAEDFEEEAEDLVQRDKVWQWVSPGLQEQFAEAVRKRDWDAALICTNSETRISLCIDMMLA